MQNRKRNVSCLSRSIQRKRGASLGERSALVAPKRPRSTLDTAKLVLVEWLDALAQGEWHEAKREDLRCKTVGFVVFEDDEQIELAGTITEGMCNNSITIPKKMLTKRKEIKLETAKRKSKGKKATAVDTGSDTPTVPYADH
jgi:hypothetical protein